MSRKAVALPDISRPTSNPSFIPSCFWASAIDCSRTSRASVAPILRARSSRYGFTSVTTTCRAPAWRTMAAAITPIGPAPVISTSSPEHGKMQRRVNGVAERIEDRLHVARDRRLNRRIVDPDIGHRKREKLGKRARPIHADAAGVLAEMASSRQAVAAMATDDMPFAADDIAGMKVLYVGSDLDDFSDELMANDHRHGNRPAGPCVPVIDMHVGAADAGAEDLDQHIADSDRRDRHLIEPEAFLILQFHQRGHGFHDV